MYWYMVLQKKLSAYKIKKSKRTITKFYKNLN